ncbi:MAG: MopE-related protein [Candidatus Uhrbacteria bacterium]|nr:MopE-related protein [Candidatus Uhrbacteria bacterium]
MRLFLLLLFAACAVRAPSADDTADTDSVEDPGPDYVWGDPATGADTDELIDSGQPDVDGDGFAADNDCNDQNSTVYPDAPEDPSNTGYGDGLDNDCDGTIDEGTNLFDDDQDGFSEADGDCDDTNAELSPGAIEVDDDGLDNDCDGVVDGSIACCADVDGDSYGNPEDCLDEESMPEDGICPENYVEVVVEYDCDDTNSTVNPGRDDPDGDGRDGDCDGSDD